MRLQIEDLPVLGVGVWGVVYDLDDGTVLKLARREGGFGDGHKKVSHEIDVMKSIAFARSNVSFKVPQFVESGFIPEHSKLYGRGFSIWLRSTKIVGRSLEDSEVARLGESERSAIAASLARALNEFHRLLDGSDIHKKLKPDDVFELMNLEDLALRERDRGRIHSVVPLFDAHSDRQLRPIHGDFNISNVLVDERFDVTGVLDFAEVCLGTLEDELSSLTTELPILAEAIVNQFEATSGHDIDPARLHLAELKHDLISLMISRYRLNRPKEALECEERFDRRLAESPRSFPL